MLNPFYIYSAIWSIVLLLYSLGWSDFNVPLDPYLTLFFALTIPVSLILGRLFRMKFVYKRMKLYPHRQSGITIALLGGYIVDFAYGQEIPLIAISTGTSKYAEFEGIPFFHAFLISFSLFYTGYLIYLYLSFPEKRGLLIEIASMFLMFLLLFSRNCLVFGLMFYVFLKLADLNSASKLKTKQIVMLALVVLVALYLFGVLGNVRSGYSWNDTLFIRTIGRYNDSYPFFLSEQFMWAYTYITSPLANLNLNIMTDNVHADFLNYLMCYVPEAISKRLAISQSMDLNYWFEPLNACTGFIDLYYYGGLPGLFLSYGVESLIFFILCSIKNKANTRALICCVCCVMTAANFFFNPFVFTGLSFMLLYAFFLPSQNVLLDTAGKEKGA